MRHLTKAIAALLAFLFAGQALAQSSPSAFTTGMRYDAMHHLTGTIAPDPDGTGPLKHAAVRNTYDANGRPWKVETGELASWQSEAVAPANWTGFTVLQSVETSYDMLGRKTKELVRTGSNGTIYTVVQFSYDSMGRPECSAVRMNPAEFASLPASACSLDTAGSFGPDRITKNIYDNGGQLLQIRKAFGVTTANGFPATLEQAYATYSYTPNGKQEYVVDANGNRAKLEYDNYDRLKKWIFPSTTKPTSFNPATPATALATAGSLNTNDYEQYTYDANGNRTGLRKRDATDIAFSYDNLNRMTVKDVDANNERSDLSSTDERDIYYKYELRGLQTEARFTSTSGVGVFTSYSGFGAITTASTSLITGTPQLSYLYDKNGNRTRITHPGSVAFDMTFDGLNRLKEIKKGATVLVAPTYTTRGAVSKLDRYNTALDQDFGYDPIGRLNALDFGLAVTHSAKVGWDFTARNPASQILTEARDNDSYAWAGRQDGSLAYTANGLNQYSAVGSNAYCHDANGNLTDDGEFVYKYDIENRLVEKRNRVLAAGTCPSYTSGYTGPLQASLHYDPMGRLYEIVGGGNTTRFLNDGDALVLEYDGSNAVIQRYVHGNDMGADDPLVWYPGSGTADSNIRNLYSDTRGSIVLVMGSDGVTDKINTYDEWGVVDGTNLGRFQYTGQAWIDELGMYYYKARIYSPWLGRFLQTDPIGYEDQVNLYAYVGNDPVNGTDFRGTCAWDLCTAEGAATAVVVIGATAALTCYASGACEKFSDAVQKGIEQANETADQWFGDGDEASPQGPTTSEARKDGSATPAGRRTPVPGTGRRAGDVKPARVRPGQVGPPTTGPKGKKSDGPQTATRGGNRGGVQGSRTQGRKFGSEKGNPGRQDDGHRGGPPHNHAPPPKKGHWWWPW